MKISQIVWLQKIADKIAAKHGLTQGSGSSMGSNVRKMSIEEASEFWDDHSVADFPSRVVEMEYTPEGRTTFVAIEDRLLGRLTAEAREQGVSVETLVNLWVQEKLTA